MTVYTEEKLFMTHFLLIWLVAPAPSTVPTYVSMRAYLSCLYPVSIHLIDSGN